MTSQNQQRVLITGASSGIGRATALAFAKTGANLALVSRSNDALTTLAQEAQSLGVEAKAYCIDLACIEQVAEKITEVGAVDVLVNNAGIGYTAELSETPLSEWQSVLDLNLTSPLQCIQAVLPSMRAKGRGSIVNVVSIGGRQVFSQWGAYCTSKFGLMALTKTLALEERSHGIRVMAICPGAVNTSLWDSPDVDADFERSAMLSSEDVAQAIVSAVQLPQHAVIEELVLMPNVGTF
ncbi:Sepiapterin reductase [Acaryochloris thomasi RCC1774]|uniref:Sepiapterin reductase n=1 Tax=Acaryochloris thomasi RCC1774 TaxID=1764569 RepID=A0A2W1JBL6_9CYAN|nr:SDR family oxidoreductase [Acaryochloris thomasi]PZD71286.1 Sepiapterin reductase [Acaryochloris thomasi RCC1774]